MSLKEFVTCFPLHNEDFLSWFIYCINKVTKHFELYLGVVEHYRELLSLIGKRPLRLFSLLHFLRTLRLREVQGLGQRHCTSGRVEAITSILVPV
jgi:hypothetical protein